MGLTYSDMQRTHNTDGWSVVGGFHTTCLSPTLGAVAGDDQPPAPLWLFEGDNNANAKYLSRPMPRDGQNPNISTSWEFWFKINDVGADRLHFIVGNQQVTQLGSATLNGYGVRWEWTTNSLDLLLITGGAVAAVIGQHFAAPPYDNFNRVRISREVSGANRFWRMYFNDMTTPVAGPTNEATYSGFAWWGWDHGTRPRIICGAEACRS